MLAKSEPTSNSGSTKNDCRWRKEWEYVRKTALQTPRSVKKEQEEVLQHERRLPWSPLRPMVEQISTYSLWRTPQQRWGVLKGGWDTMESICWSRTCGPMEKGAHTGARWLAGLVNPLGDPCWSSSWRTAARGKLEKFKENCFPWEELHTGAEEEYDKSSPWGGRISRDNAQWIDCHSHSPSSLCYWDDGQSTEKLEMKLKLGKREGESGFKFGFISHYPPLIWLDNECN